MGLQEIKRLRAETGASLSECKQALESTSSFEDAVVFAQRLASLREQAELADANESARAAAEAHAAREAVSEFVRSMLALDFLTETEVRDLLATHDHDLDVVESICRSLAEERRVERARRLAEEKAAKMAQLDANSPRLDTSFRSAATLRGSSKVTITFECVQDARISFRLDVSSGVLDRIDGWHPYLLMPGGDPADPEPLGCWWVCSHDETLEIELQVDGVNAVYVDGKSRDESGRFWDVESLPEVERLLQDLTNVAVRDLWNEANS